MTKNNQNLEPVNDPAKCLQDLQKQADETTKQVQLLYTQILSSLNNFKSCGKMVLFRDETLHIVNGRHIIKGIEIYTFPWHNNCLDAQIHCMAPLKIKIIMEFNPKEVNLSNVDSDDLEELDWKISLYDLKIWPGNDKDCGFIGNSAGDDSVFVRSFPDFLKLQELIIKGVNHIGFKVMDKSFERA